MLNVHVVIKITLVNYLGFGLDVQNNVGIVNKLTVKILFTCKKCNVKQLNPPITYDIHEVSGTSESGYDVVLSVLANCEHCGSDEIIECEKA